MSVSTINVPLEPQDYKVGLSRLQVARLRFADKLRLDKRPLVRGCLGEFTGTFILIVFGCGVIAQVELGNKKHGDFNSIALGWGMAVTMGVYFGCGGHSLINPAVTLAFATIGKIPFKLVPFYTVSQIMGGMFGALAIVGIYHEKLVQASQVTDGNFLVNTTGGIFVTRPHISNFGALVDQIFGTALLSSGALVIVDHNAHHIPGYLHPLLIGLMVYTIVGCFALNAGAALNPARDFGPRLAISISGWGIAAFTDSNYYFWIPIIGPYIGAIFGAIFYEAALGIHMPNAGGRARIRRSEQMMALEKVNKKETMPLSET